MTMCQLQVCLLAFFIASPLVGASSSQARTWLQALDQTGAEDTPVTRVVGLLKQMQGALTKEMDEDSDLYKKLSCWCNDNKWEKKNSIEDAEAKIQELSATIESLSAKSQALKVKIEDTEKDVAANKKALAEATEIREKQLQDFHGGELDSVQAIENLKAAIIVLSKHHSAAFPQLGVSFLATGSKHTSVFSDLDLFMDKHDFVSEGTTVNQRFLQQTTDALQPQKMASSSAWSDEELATVQRAIQSASSFMQANHGERYYPAYAAQSGEVMGVLKQLKEEMENGLSEEQKTEMARAAAFAALREAKTKEIEEGEKMAELKEDELAKTDNDLAEAKEDLGQTQEALSTDQKFMKNLVKTCENAGANFEMRKKQRLEEIEAVADTIAILTADEARDAMSGAFTSFVQVSSNSRRTGSKRYLAASMLRKAARRSKNAELVALATSIELDTFTKVKKAIDDMIGRLKKQQEAEVKKKDWCKGEIQKNEMDTMKTTDRKSDLEVVIDELSNKIKTLEEEIETGKARIAQLQVALQKANEDRKDDNIEFQKTIEEQTLTIAVLLKALDRLATYYDKESFTQSDAHGRVRRQTPPVPQMEYKPSKASGGVMSMIEKLVYDARELKASSLKSEKEAQAAYEQTIEDTNESLATLQAQVVSKTKGKVKAVKDKQQTESDLSDTVTELDVLHKYNMDLHEECDYIMNNFLVRQQARADETEALQQAKQILQGASFN